MSDRDHEATAKRLLPCHCTVKAGDYHTVDCPANYRDEVAAALAERDAEIERLNKIVIENAGYCYDKNNELAQLREKLNTKLAEVQKRHYDLWEVDRKIIADLKAERDAAEAKAGKSNG